ncbi:hypothetical protein TSMEX_002672 [Taenia solium]|eukprot:TsM_000359800 transcript=TsM_000359800 gene=TsM_000359800
MCALLIRGEEVRGVRKWEKAAQPFAFFGANDDLEMQTKEGLPSSANPTERSVRVKKWTFLLHARVVAMPDSLPLPSPLRHATWHQTIRQGTA